MGILKRFFIFLLIFSFISNIALAETPPPIPSIPPPSITSVSPNSGSGSSYTEITISGSNFSSQASGKIGSINLLDLKWIDKNTIKVVVPSGLTAGSYDIEIINPGNLKGILPNGFTVTASENSGSSSSGGGGGGPSSSGGGGSPASSVQSAVPTGKIKGRIINASGIPILGLPARINNIRMATTITGEFEFTLVADGIYTVYYEANGYISQTQVLVVLNGGITLAPTVILSPNVVVSINPSSVSKLNKKAKKVKRAKKAKKVKKKRKT
ncbi:MAG: IPT/TIG domain-containing protein [Actinobacteria bacterium]|nr:IPT/TIG domain-containing protein [Actinomycetota bacterium]